MVPLAETRGTMGTADTWALEHVIPEANTAAMELLGDSIMPCMLKLTGPTSCLRIMDRMTTPLVTSTEDAYVKVSSWAKKVFQISELGSCAGGGGAGGELFQSWGWGDYWEGAIGQGWVLSRSDRPDGCVIRRKQSENPLGGHGIEETAVGVPQ